MRRHLASNTLASTNGNIFRITGPLCGEFTSHQWIPITMATNAEFWGAPEQTVK